MNYLNYHSQKYQFLLCLAVRRRSYQQITEDDLIKDPVVKATEISMDR